MREVDYVILHAAALKHVPAAEYNPTNVSRPIFTVLKMSLMPQ